MVFKKCGPNSQIQTNLRQVIISLLTFLLLPTHLIANGYKHVAVPTQDISKQALPNLLSSSVSSHSTMLRVNAQSQQNKITAGSSWSQNIIVDSAEATSILFLSPSAGQVNLTVQAPNGSIYLNESRSESQKLSVKPVAMGNQSFSGKELSLPASSTGIWKISMQLHKEKGAGQLPAGYLLAKGDPAYKLITHLDNKFTTKNSRTHIVAFLVSDRDSGIRNTLNRANQTNRRNLTNVIQIARATITLPNGQTHQITLNDQGINGDKIAGDGKYSAPVPTSLTGTYTTDVYVEGIRPDGIAFSRSTADLYPVETKSFDFAGQYAKLTSISGTQNSIQIPIKTLANTHQEVFFAGEVWGTNQKGKEVAATWVGGIAQPVVLDRTEWLEIGFDSRWLSHAGLSAPYYLKSLRLQTVNTNTPIAFLKHLQLKASKGTVPKPDNGLTNRYANEDRSLVPKSAALIQPYLTSNMLAVPAPGTSAKQPSLKKEINAAGGKLMLVHGYCSSDVWNSNQFSNDIKFADFDKSRSHDQFARLIRDFGSAYPSFGIVAHSQGGAAALQLYAKYYSGLDYASGARLIQSVGTPYQGTSLAGNIAALGDIFGVGCGRNTDLTYNGAANWLSTIPGWARAKVNYYTTSFTKKWWRPDWCNFASDFILSDPEDGTTERWSGQLSGGVNRGHKTGWCHTNGMRDPAQFKDSGRNAEMNANAAR